MSPRACCRNAKILFMLPDLSISFKLTQRRHDTWTLVIPQERLIIILIKFFIKKFLDGIYSELLFINLHLVSRLQNLI